jgi:hypothetical protein
MTVLNKSMITKQLNEGQGSINVETHYDISRIQKLAGLANGSTVAGTPVTEDIRDDINNQEAQELAGQLESLVHLLDNTLGDIEQLIRDKLPREYRSMEQYTLAHIKAAVGGYGYAENRMAKSLHGLVEDLVDYSQGSEDTL